MRLKGKKALITGGSDGIGLAIAQAFLKEGATVAIIGRSLDKLIKAQTDSGGGILAFQGDVSSSVDLKQIYEENSKIMKNLDIVVANAGIAEKTLLGSTTEDQFEKLISTNVKGVFLTVQCALPYLNPGSSIILISSLAGKLGVKEFSVYAASKAAVTSFAKSFAADLAPQKIRVNSISPGVVKTPILEKANLSKEALDLWTNNIPMHRMAQPSEIAHAAVYLASDESSYMTATDIGVDGGVSGISPL